MMTVKQASNAITNTFATVAAAAVIGAMPQPAMSQVPGSPYTTTANLGPAKLQTWGVRNFGYLVTDPSNAALVAETKPYSSNVAFGYDADNPTGSSAAMSQLSSDFKGVIFINNIFMKSNGTPYTTGEIVSRLATFKSTLGSKASHVSHLAFDEPVWAAHRGTVAPGGGPKADVTLAITRNLEIWAAQLRQQFPSVGLMVIEAHPMVRPSLILPANFDLYGVDCYESFNNCSSDAGGNYSMTTLFQTMRNKVNDLNNSFGGHRRLALVPPTHMRANADQALLANTGLSGNSELLIDTRLFPPSSAPDTAAKNLVNQHLALAASEPMVTMVGGFLWNTLQEGTMTWYGARGLPQVRAQLAAYGRSVTGKSGPTPLVPPLVIDFQSVAGNTSGQAVWSWASNALNCRSVTEQSGPYQPNGLLVGSILSTNQSYTIECTGQNGVVAQRTINPRMTIPKKPPLTTAY